MICAALHENRFVSSLFCSFACWWSFVEQDWWLFTVSSDRCESMDSTLQVGIELKRCFYVGLALFQCFPTFWNWFTFWTNYCKIIYSRYCCVPLHHFRARSNFLGILHQWGLPWTSVILCCDFFKRPTKIQISERHPQDTSLGHGHQTQCKEALNRSQPHAVGHKLNVNPTWKIYNVKTNPVS